ncbi:hypothetical protein ACFWN2_18910 [Lentzea sp. NPDC058436]|uniref:hypothetical protein n=1 Tax=Lentzea sp. NPDC058436 TaxID=3346499 RepID=UPI00364D72E4
MADTVLDKANRLKGEARRLADGAEGMRQATRISERVTKLRDSLQSLARQVTLAKSVNSAIGAPLVDLSGLSAGLEDFKKKAEASPNPLDPVFKAARTKVETLTNRLRDRTLEVWQRWATARVQDLPYGKLPMLNVDQQPAARSKKQDLDRMITKSDLNSSDVRVFRTTLETLGELLGTAKDVPAELAAVLDRLARTPSPRLADVSDDEIRLLRSAGLDTEIAMKRTGG